MFSDQPDQPRDNTDRSYVWTMFSFVRKFLKPYLKVWLHHFTFQSAMNDCSCYCTSLPAFCIDIFSVFIHYDGYILASLLLELVIFDDK